MRTISIFATTVIASTTSAFARACYWLNGSLYCDGGCRVTDRWWDGHQQWMRYSCGLPPEFLITGAVVVIAIIVGVLMSSASGTRNSSALTEATKEADAQAAEAARITERMKAAAAEADQFLKTYK